MQVKKLTRFFAIFLIALVCCFTFKVNAQIPETTNLLTTIIDDMKPFHQGMPHGVPTSYDWASRPRIGMGNNPEGFEAMIAWGQLYEAAEGNPASNTRVQIRDIKAYILSKQDSKWHLLQSSKGVKGAAYREDFAGDINKPANVRNEQNDSISVKAGNGYNFHFWCKTGRVPIDPNDVDGIFTTTQARLVIDNNQAQDDRNKARYLLSMAGDYWPSLTAGWDKRPAIGDIAIGKFKYVTKEWQAFNMTTLTPTQIMQNPPPME